MMTDEALAMLADRHRRRLLVQIGQKNPRDEADIPGEVTFADEGVAEIASKLEAVHLPMLADAGFIDWDRNTGEIRRGPNFEELRPLLELIVAHQDELPAGWL